MEGGNFTAETAFDEDGGSVSRSAEQPSDYGAHSPRPARSQISTAVSFEPASERPANSAAVAARSGEDSALSAAEPEGELSSLPQPPLQETADQEGPAQPGQVRQAYPSGSLLSTAVRPVQPQQQQQHQHPQQHVPQQPPSPRANRANSLVSKTPREANRAGTPASVYGQGRSLGRQLRADSPFGYEQNSTAAPARGQQEARERLQGPPEPEQQPQKSEWREAPVMHLDGAASQPPAGHQQAGFPQDDMQEGYMSEDGRNNSIDAMQQGEAGPAEGNVGAFAGPAIFAQSPGLHAGHPRPRMPAAAHAHHRQHHSFAAGAGAHMERSASAGSKSERGHRSGQRRGWPDGPSHAHAHVAHDAHAGSRARHGNGAARPSPAQQSGVAGERLPYQVGSYGTVDEPQLAEAFGQLPPPPPPVFMAPAPPATLPLFGQAAAQHHPALLNVQRLLRVLDNNGNLLRQHAAAAGPHLLAAALPHMPAAAAAASAGAAVPLEPLLRQLSQHLSTSWQSCAEPAHMMDQAGSVRLGADDQGDNMDAEQGGGSNSAAEQYLSGDSSEPTARLRPFLPPQHAAHAGAGPAYALQPAGSLQRPAEGQLVDPALQEHLHPASGSPTGEGMWPRQRASAQEAIAGPAASWGFARSVQQATVPELLVQEANSLPAAAHHGHAAAVARSAALPALSVIQGELLEPFHARAAGSGSEAGTGGRGPQHFTGQGRLSAQLQGHQLENVASVGQEDDAPAHFGVALPAQNSTMLPRQGMRAEGDGQPVDSLARSLGDAGGAGENCASCIAVPPLNQEAADGPYAQGPDTAHAAASVHATVMSEEDAQSEGETNLSSMRGHAQRSAPVRSGHAHGHARRPQHHSAGSPPAAYAEHQPPLLPREEDVPRPLDSTTGMAAAPAPAASGGQSVEMCTHGSGSAWATAQEPSNSSGSSPARPAQSRRRTPSLGAAQGATSAAEGMGRTFSSSAHVDAGQRMHGRSMGLPAAQPPDALDRSGADAMVSAGADMGAEDQVEDNIGGPARQNSNGTTIGQLLAAGPQSVLTTAGQGEEPEGSLASQEGMEQQGEAGLMEASPSDAAGRIAAAASAAAAAASAKLGTLLAGVAPHPPLSHLRGASSCAEARPAVPHFEAARSHGGMPEEPVQLPGEAQPQFARISSSSLLYQAPQRSRSVHPYEGSADAPGGLPDARHGNEQPTSPEQNHSTAAATSAKETSEGEPAQATVTAGAHSAGGSPTAELEMQSHPSPFTPQHASPHPAAAVVIVPSGRLPHASEGKGESHPAAERPDAAASPARLTNGSVHALTNGHGAAHARLSGHADVLSGEDSAPDDGPAVTSPATGTTPGRRRSLVGKRKRVSAQQQQSRGRFSTASTS